MQRCRQTPVIRSPNSGFSLVELAVLVLVSAMIMTAIVTIQPGQVQRTDRKNTKTQITEIQAALAKYKTRNNRYPCPASYDDLPGSANYGRQSLTDCVTDTSTPSGTTRVETSGGSGIYVRGGAVPVRDLLLPDSYMSDEYGNRYSYVVTEQLTSATYFDDTSGAIAVVDKDDASVTTSAAYAVISHGKDGKGAYRDITAAQKAACGATTNLDVENCDGDVTYRTANYSETTTEALYYDDFLGYADRPPTLLGFRVDGTVAGDYSGYSIATGDINGDSYDDLIIGAYKANKQGGVGAGYVYVIFGTEDGIATTPFDLTTLDGDNGFRLDGYDQYGIAWSVGQTVGSGDINGDGYDDIFISSLENNNGMIYVVFGKSGTWPASQYLISPVFGGSPLLDGTQGFRIREYTFSQWMNYGQPALTAGDINNDGYDDLLIGAPSSGSTSYVYVVFGKSGSWNVTEYYDTTAGYLIDGTKGFRIESTAAGQRIGYSLAAGDVNGDGYDDIIIGAQSAYYTHIVFGKSGSWSATRTLVTTVGGLMYDGTEGFRLDGSGASPSVAAGDIDNDGYADIIIGSPYADTNTGYVFVVFGKSNWTADPTLDLTSGGVIDGAQGFRLDGTATGLWVGSSVASADINNDGYEDIIIGAHFANSMAGYTYVVFGKDTGWSATQALTTTGGSPLIDGTTSGGFRLDGSAASDYGGYAVAVGNIDGDDYADIFTSSHRANSSAGYTYGIYGKASAWGSVTYDLNSNTTP